MKTRTLALILTGALATTVVVATREEIAYQIDNARRAIGLTLPSVLPKKDYVELRKNPVVFSVFYRERDGIASAELTDLTTGEKRDVTNHLKNAEKLSGGDYLTSWDYNDSDSNNGLDRTHQYKLKIVDLNGDITKSN